MLGDKRKQKWLVNNTNAKNVKYIDHDYVIGNKVLIINEDIDFKAMDKHIGPFPIIPDHTKSTMKIQCDCIMEHIHVRRLMSYFE